MKSILKWLVIIGGVVLVLVITAILILPKIIDVKKYKPVIEQKITQATGRSFTLGDEMDLSVFPWVGVKLTNLHLGNPEGYGKKDMVSVKKFEVRLKVMPLLSRRIQVKTFVLDSPEIYLEKLKNGKANWQGIGNPKEKKSSGSKKNQHSPASQGLPIKALQVDKFSITNGQLIFVDLKTRIKKEITDLNLNLNPVNLESPVGIMFSAMIDKKPFSLKGMIGPVGNEPGRGNIGVDLVLKALGELVVKLKGNLIDPVVSQGVDLQLNVLPFSVRKLLAKLNQALPLKTKDPEVLNKVSLNFRLKGNKDAMTLSEGVLNLDDSRLDFSASAKEFFKPNLAFNIKLDAIDLDRYLSQPAKQKQDPDLSQKTSPVQSVKKKTDYGPLRKLVLDGRIKAGKIKIHGAVMENLIARIKASDGIITMDPLGVNLYNGSVASKLELNVQKKYPGTRLVLNARGIQAGPMIKDALQKELIEGTLTTNLEISMIGEDPERIKQTLNGQGELVFFDGAVIGIDLANAVRNVKVKFGMAEKSTEKPRTDFAELKMPFKAENGLVNINGTRLVSPLIRVLVTGDVNLVKELVDLRVEPKFVATLKGQGDTRQRSGIMVPVLVTGFYSSPEIRPDLKGMINNGLKPDAQGLKKILESKGGSKQKVKSSVKDVKKQVRGLLHGFGSGTN